MTDTDPDFIIVGAGAAGCTLAREILVRGLGSVLLLESGSVPRSSRLRVPSDYLLAFGSPWDWGYLTAPQLKLGQRAIRLPAGHALGGSTSINAMIWIEPAPCDLEVWHRELGPAWSPQSIERAFQPVRTWLADSQLPTLPPLHPRMQRILDQSVEWGWNADCFPSGFQQPRGGIGAYRRMQHRGRRVSLWRLLEWEERKQRAVGRSLLTILPNTRALRLCFDGDRVVGVRLGSIAGQGPELRARRGVILCGGAIETPRLLMASGLGPREMLERSGIACRVDLPQLGSNLQDHLVFPIVYQSESLLATPERRRADRWQYATHRSGPRASNLAELGGFFVRSPTNLWDNPPNGFDFQVHITPTHYLEPTPFAGHGDHVSFAVTPLRARSRGNLALAQARGGWDPETAPPLVIDPHYLAEECDRRDYLAAIEEVRNLIERSPWSSWIGREVFPKGRGNHRLGTYLERFASTIYHYAGTCAMGKSSTSCLNESMEVHGVDHLWVCDASAMPHLVGCNPQASVAMMAVRLADWL
jgi:choline dehydrogenase